MANLRLDIVIVPTYDNRTLAVLDASTYPTTPSNPTIEITVPGFNKVVLPFNINSFNVFNSESLGLTSPGDPLLPLPDGVYFIKYSVTPAFQNFVEKSIMRVDQLQEMFDSAFMRLDMMQCDLAIKTQQKVTLNSIYYFIQGSIAAANSCAIEESNRLYNQAKKMLINFSSCGCGSSGNNYVTNFY